MIRHRIALALIVAASWIHGGCPPPGRGARAWRGYDRADPVIAALERYREDRGRYPDTLIELVPDYLAERGLAVPKKRTEDYPLEYSVGSWGYEIVFRYVGPGMNVCRFNSMEKCWRCSGYF